MSKKEVKGAIKDLDRDQLVDLILDLYSNVKQAKEYLDFYANPDEETKAEEIKEKIFKEFFPSRHRFGKCRFSPGKKLISDFVKMGGSQELVLDLMIYLCEIAGDALKRYGIGKDSYHVSSARNISAAFEYAVAHDLCKKEQARLTALHDFACSYLGYGVYSLIRDAVSDFMADLKE